MLIYRGLTTSQWYESACIDLGNMLDETEYNVR